MIPKGPQPSSTSSQVIYQTQDLYLSAMAATTLTQAVSVTVGSGSRSGNLSPGLVAITTKGTTIAVWLP